MLKLTALKQLSIRTGLYRPARFVHRLLDREESSRFDQELAFYANLIPPGSLCFDIGANIGEKTEVFLRAGATVIAFEPQPDCVKELKARCGHYGKKLHVEECALGERAGEATMHLRQSSGHGSLLSDWQGTPYGELPVSISTVDAAIAKYGRPMYIKIDVEGYELNVLKGLTQTVPLLSFEYHLSDREIATSVACLEYLAQSKDITINVVPFDNMEFALPGWLRLEQFTDIFPSAFRNRRGFFYGDIFVSTCNHEQS